MERLNDISVKEALERLHLPTFFDDEERLAAFFMVNEQGNPIQKVLAEKAICKYPIQNIFDLTIEAA